MSNNLLNDVLGGLPDVHHRPLHDRLDEGGVLHGGIVGAPAEPSFTDGLEGGAVGADALRRGRAMRRVTCRPLLR
jgi:hypothetical protein